MSENTEELKSQLNNSEEEEEKKEEKKKDGEEEKEGRAKRKKKKKGLGKEAKNSRCPTSSKESRQRKSPNHTQN